MGGDFIHSAPIDLILFEKNGERKKGSFKKYCKMQNLK